MHGPTNDDIAILASAVALKAYLNRVGAVLRNFQKAVVYGETVYGNVRGQLAVITVKDGTLKCSAEEYAPTETEADAIKLELVQIEFPKPVPARIEAAEAKGRELGVDPSQWFMLLNRDRNRVIMCQQRCEDKQHLPWTFWSDGKWRNMEPDGLLPLWKPSERKSAMLAIHEGAKAARCVDQLLANKEELAKHPWAVELAQYEHWGWVGGASRPYDTDWREVVAENPVEVVIVADRDRIGIQAIRHIARALSGLKAPVWALLFPDDFKEGFDLANDFPQQFLQHGRYRGPRWADCLVPATMATKMWIDEEDKPHYELRPPFIEQWVHSTKPYVFVHRRRPTWLLDEAQFNTDVRPFSHLKNTAALLKEEIGVASVAYEPGAHAGIIIVDGFRCFNTWSPTRIKKCKGDVKPWEDFLAKLFPVEADRNYLKRWIATLIARPTIRMKHGLLLISETQGVGKGTLMEKILAPLVGWHNTSVPSEKQIIDSAFNSWLVRRRLVLVHEIYAGHTKKAYDTLKSKVTDDTLTVNEKNRPEYENNNWTHFILSSNSHLALRLVKGDRRWFVPEVTERKQSEQYWIELNAWLVNGGLELIHQWAYDYLDTHEAISAGADAPSSVAKERLIDAGRSAGMELAFDLATTAMAQPDAVVLTDRAVRAWVAAERGLELSDANANLESLRTIREMLAQAGMVLAYQTKVRGARCSAYGNAKAMTLTPEQVLQLGLTIPADLVEL